jgi:PAS domain S-box-containing protein
MISHIADRIRGLSLKWKLLIPFLFFAFAGTTILAYIGLSSQQRLIKEEEKKELLHYYRQFLEGLGQKKIQALSLATMIAENPEVQGLLEGRKREALRELMIYTYVRLKMDYNVEQVHFHVPPATSFLRLHFLEKYGDDMASYRHTILDAIRTGRATAGVERGATGLGVRGVVPVFRYGKIVGSVEIGHSLGEPLLKEFYEIWNIDLTLFEAREKGGYRTLARAGKGPEVFLGESYLPRIGGEAPTILIAPPERPDRAIIFGPVKDYSGKPVAMVEISLDRSETQDRLSRSKRVMIMVGLAGIAVSFLLTYLVALLFIRPIKEIVREAQDIALEKREIRLESRPADEIGSLTQALNVMLDALKERRREIEEHATTLERRVRERTADLVESEEKFRTLVENVPLIVYRVLEDGTTEFINSYLTESLGYTIEEAVGNRRFWRERICGSEGDEYQDLWGTFLQDGEARRTERKVRDKEGRLLTFIDHAIPTKDGEGNIKWVDGIMIDITELKRLQERALFSEEIRILGEISAHMAHEIRNPLSTAGGFARRLRDSLPIHDPKRGLAGIIVDEVARLEGFLKALLSSIRPFELSPSDLDVNQVLEEWVSKLEGRLRSRHIEVVKDLSPNIPRIQGDEEKLNQAFENILKHAVISTPEGERLFIGTSQALDRMVVTLRHRVYRLSEDDLEKFFFPHIEDESEWNLLDLPFSKIIIHRHGGKIDLTREGDNMLVMRIEFPMKSTAESHA